MNRRPNSYVDITQMNGDTNPIGLMPLSTPVVKLEATPNHAEEFLARLDHTTSKVVGSSLLKEKDIHIGRTCTHKGETRNTYT